MAHPYVVCMPNYRFHHYVSSFRDCERVEVMAQWKMGMSRESRGKAQQEKGVPPTEIHNNMLAILGVICFVM